MIARRHIIDNEQETVADHLRRSLGTSMHPTSCQSPQHARVRAAYRRIDRFGRDLPR